MKVCVNCVSNFTPFADAAASALAGRRGGFYHPRTNRSAFRPLSAASPTSSPLPAVLFCDPATASLRVVALTLLDRLVVAAHRAGCAPILVVSAGELPDLRRSRALGIAVNVAGRQPELTGPVLVAGTRQLVQAGDLRELLKQGGRLATKAGVLLPAGVIPGARLSKPLVPVADASGSESRAPGAAELDAILSALPVVTAQGVAASVTDAESARAAGEALWRSLSSSADGVVDRWFNRPVGRLLFSRWLVHTPVTPNQVSVAATVMGVVAGGMFAVGSPGVSVAAAALFQVSAIVDCVDGDVARAVFKESPLGKWLDLVGDQVVHGAVFLGIAAGLWRTESGPFLWLGASAVLGGLIAFMVVLRGMKAGGGDRRLQKLIDALTNRDFSVLVLGLACVGRLEWFLWLAAIGSHVFWVLALVVQVTGARRAGAAR